MPPQISIIIPCFNQELFIEETLNSVQQQTYMNWECLVVDDGSTDDSANIIKQWCEKDSRFRLLPKQNGGLSSARNHGLDHATGEWIQFLDGDDMLFPNKLSDSMNAVSENIDIVVTSFNHLKNNRFLPPYCQLKESYLSYKSILMQWDMDFSIPIHCALFRARAIGETRFNETITAGEDWLFWLKVFHANPQAVFIDNELVCYRLHERSITQDTHYMITHKHRAHLIIYDSLEGEYKRAFFDRFSQEALDRRTELFRRIELDKRKRERKLTKRLKAFLKGLLR